MTPHDDTERISRDTARDINDVLRQHAERIKGVETLAGALKEGMVSLGTDIKESACTFKSEMEKTRAELVNLKDELVDSRPWWHGARFVVGGVVLAGIAGIVGYVFAKMGMA